MMRLFPIMLAGALAGASTAAAQSITAILTKDLPIYSEAVDLFEATLKSPVVRHDMKGDSLEGKIVAATLNKERPPLVLAVGAAAARIAEYELDEAIPVVFCMVVDPEAAGLLNARHSTGASLAVPLEVQLRTARLVLPTLSIIAALFDSAATAHIVEEAFFVAADLDLRVLPIPVSEDDAMADVVEALPEDVGVLWMLPDAVVLREAETVIEAARSKGIPVLAPTRKLVKMGALLALSPDYRDSGRQAAEMARKILLGVRPQDLPIEPPSSYGLAVNRASAEMLGIEVAKSLPGMVIEYE